MKSTTTMRKGMVALAIPLTLVAGACAGSGSDAQSPDGEAMDIVVESDDGRALIRIPAAALPEDVTADDITIEELEISEEAEPGTVAPLMAHELKPDGLELDGPATLEVKLNQEDVADGLVIFHLDGDDVSGVEPELVQETDGSFTARFEVEHFSFVVYWPNIYFGVDVVLPAEDEFTVGQSFEYKVRIYRQQGPFEYPPIAFLERDSNGIIRQEKAVRVPETSAASEQFEVGTRGGSAYAAGSLDPPNAKFPQSPEKAAGTWEGSTTFTCARAGSGSISYYLASVDFEVSFGSSLADAVPLMGWVWSRPEQVSCREEEEEQSVFVLPGDTLELTLTDGQGDCNFPESFGATFDVTQDGRKVQLAQEGTDQKTKGTVTSEGKLETRGETGGHTEIYQLQVDGKKVKGRYSYFDPTCDHHYKTRGRLR